MVLAIRMPLGFIDSVVMQSSRKQKLDICYLQIASSNVLNLIFLFVLNGSTPPKANFGFPLRLSHTNTEIA